MIITPKKSIIMFDFVQGILSIRQNNKKTILKIFFQVKVNDWKSSKVHDVVFPLINTNGENTKVRKEFFSIGPLYLTLIFRYSSLDYFIKIDLCDNFSLFNNFIMSSSIIGWSYWIFKNNFHSNIRSMVCIFRSYSYFLIISWSFKTT